MIVHRGEVVLVDEVLGSLSAATMAQIDDRSRPASRSPVNRVLDVSMDLEPIRMTIYDITIPMSDSLAVWQGDTPFRFTWTWRKKDGATVNVGQFGLSVHTGTHADAPFHYDDAGATIDSIGLEPFIGAARVISIPGQLRRRRDKGEIEVAPIAFMRGRTLNHAFVIVDEAQNASRLQMKMVLTRLGEGARMAVTGDPSQVDLVNPRDSGLSHAIAILEGVKGVGVARFEASDVVRHPLVERIVTAYDADAAKRPQ